MRRRLDGRGAERGGICPLGVLLLTAAGGEAVRGSGDGGGAGEAPEGSAGPGSVPAGLKSVLAGFESVLAGLAGPLGAAEPLLPRVRGPRVGQYPRRPPGGAHGASSAPSPSFP